MVDLLLLLLYCYCKCSVALPHGVLDWFAVCDCGISWSYSLTLVVSVPIYKSVNWNVIG